MENQLSLIKYYGELLDQIVEAHIMYKVRIHLHVNMFLKSLWRLDLAVIKAI